MLTNLPVMRSGADGPANRWPLLRWFISSGTLGVPQAAGPIAFSLVALGLTGEPAAALP